MARCTQWGRLAIIVVLVITGCRDEAKPEPTTTIDVPLWVPLLARPLPGHGNNPAVQDSSIRQLTAAELVAVAYKFHPRIDPEDYTIEEWKDAFWKSPEQLALAQVQHTGYGKLAEWQTLCDAVRRAIPSAFTVADRTYPRYDPTYVIVVDAPPEPGSIDEKHLLVHVSYLVPYYFVYELHSRRIDGKIQRDPIRFEVTPLFKDALAAIEREIVGRYGYWRLSPKVGEIQVPGIHINGYHDWDKHPPTLHDALFTPHRW